MKSTTCVPEVLNLSGKTHPPLIGFGYDGLALFGIYRPGTGAAMLGYSIGA